jgi:hypothetical protein
MELRYFLLGFLLFAGFSNAQDAHSPKVVPGGIATITINHQCVNVFGGIVRDYPIHDQETGKTVQSLDRAVHVTLTLAPGCERGISAVRTGIWPEFSKTLHFEFALLDQSGEHKSEKHLRAEVREDYTPAWRESGSVRTLVFALPDLSADSHGELLVIILSPDTKLAQLKLTLIPRRE